MSNFEGFVFVDPSTKKQKSEGTSAARQDQPVEELTDRFTFMQTDDNDQSATQRLSEFRALLSPLSSKSRNDLQERRRRDALDLQKKQRHMSITKARQIASLDTDTDEEEDESEKEDGGEMYEPQEAKTEPASSKRHRGSSDEEMAEAPKLVKYEPTKSRQKKKSKKHSNIHANQIMLAETIESLPDDFLENWTMVICPKGKRCLVTSGGGVTIARSRGGFIINRFQSLLPNGSRGNRRTTDFCILDCVYDKVHWTFYVLDIMAWHGHPAYDCDTSFRHFWLQTKIQPNELCKPNGENQFYKFKPVIPIPTTEISRVIPDPSAYLKTVQGLNYDIDGLLFYHQQALYQGGLTPLVNWLPLEDIQSFFNSQQRKQDGENRQLQQMEQ